MEGIQVLCLFFTLAVSWDTTEASTVDKSGGCRTLDGQWYNQLGSEMILNHTEGGRLFGEYRTAVERQDGAAGPTHSKVVGASPYDTPGATFAFAVMFSDGQSTSSFTGQCLVCDDEEVLVASWLLRHQVFTCLDKWESTRIGQDVFTRTEQLPGPRRSHGTNVPRETLHDHSSFANLSQPIVKRSITEDLTCLLSGTWYNELGSEVVLHHKADNSIVGEYRTAVERSRGTAGQQHSLVYGLGNVHNSETTFALFVVWNEGTSVTGWVGVSTRESSAYDGRYFVEGGCDDRPPRSPIVAEKLVSLGRKSISDLLSPRAWT